ncbi:MAG: acetoin:2,6-dichlorophenolindophenol oxidoreductase subunit alpha [Dehalococcoidia bacterium]|nr:MAG: acetoin:2,6-dichlorophenolindophenol oxidoreductase subunit alpha [Dehalococcoidia bacterium]
MEGTGRTALAPGDRELPAERLLDAYRQMLTIRRFEERALDLYRAGEMRGSTHPYIGMEAVAVGVCLALEPDDYITSTHRGHGHTIAKGGDVRRMMAELLGRATGYSGGKGGSMHIADLDRKMLGANGIVGGGMGLATGAALTAKLQRTGAVAVCFFGDGALNQGILHEVSNLAAIWSLPVVFVCENNQYAMSAAAAWTIAGGDPAKRAAGYGIPGLTVDGMDVEAVERAARDLVDRARRGDGPSYLIATTYRFVGHHAGDPLNYRPKEEAEEWRARDPIRRLAERLLARGLATAAELAAIDSEVLAQIDDAVAFAKASPPPSVAQLLTDIYA